MNERHKIFLLSLDKILPRRDYHNNRTLEKFSYYHQVAGAFQIYVIDNWWVSWNPSALVAIAMSQASCSPCNNHAYWWERWKNKKQIVQPQVPTEWDRKRQIWATFTTYCNMTIKGIKRINQIDTINILFNRISI